MKKYFDLDQTAVRINGGFWKKWRENARDMGLMSVYDRFSETGRFGSLDFSWKEGMPNKPHIFWDSDIAKWIEAAAYLLMDRRDEKIEKLIDDAVDKIEMHQRPDGYFNIYFDTCEPNERFTRYTDHELYDLGHLIEAAVAYNEATGKDKLLKCMIKYADLVYKVFYKDNYAAFDTPGHPEIELALFRLYRATNDEKWLELLRYFINTRGTSERDNTYKVLGRRSYSQAHLPVREQFTAEGHSVRACYLYCGMADLAWQDDDAGLINACKKLFDNITRRRMYITGGIGSSHVGEAFTFDYDLMNRTAYAETCAALSLALFARRLSRGKPVGKYADAAEKALYNGMLAGISLDTQSFFYENPLEVHPDVIKFNEYYTELRDHMPITSRVKVFSCSCCPPNVLRIIGSIGDFAFTQNDDELIVHHFIDMSAKTRFGEVKMETEYPFDGSVKLTLPAGGYTVGIRIPGWCGDHSLRLNGTPVSGEIRDGYEYIRGEWNDGDVIEALFDMPVKLIQAHPAVHEDCGRVAVTRGPLVYCLEEEDNGRFLKDITIDYPLEYTVSRDETLDCPVIDVGAHRREWADPDALYTEYAPGGNKPVKARFIPYYAWANRDEGEMLVWTGIKS